MPAHHDKTVFPILDEFHLSGREPPAAANASCAEAGPQEMELRIMSLDILIDTLPDYAKDLKLNYSSLVRNNTELTAQQLWGTVVVSAMATRNASLISAAF